MTQILGKVNQGCLFDPGRFGCWLIAQALEGQAYLEPSGAARGNEVLDVRLQLSTVQKMNLGKA